MKLIFGTDHAGFPLKEKIKRWLEEWGYQYEDKGAPSLDESDDYPDLIHPVAQAISENPKERKGIVLGGSGQGEAMVANRYSGVRAAVYCGGSLDIVRLSRKHNDANVLSLVARFVSDDEAKEAVKLWLETEFEGGRHVRRIKKIDKL